MFNYIIINRKRSIDCEVVLHATIFYMLLPESTFSNVRTNVVIGACRIVMLSHRRLCLD